MSSSSDTFPHAALEPDRPHPDDSTALTSWTKIWTSELYDDPAAAPASDAAALGRQLATTLLATQGLYVYDHRAKAMLFVSEGVTELLGYPPEQFTMALHYELIHSDDRAIVTEATLLTNEYCIVHRHDDLDRIVLALDYRVRHADGHWVRLLRQNFVLKRDPGGAIVAIGGLLTDISAHKHTNDVRFRVNRPDFADFVRSRRPATATLSAREREVLALVLDGMTSPQIATRLHISPATVGTHRRNIQLKARSHSMHRLLTHLDAA